MGRVYNSQGDYSKALQYYEKSLNMQLNIYGHTDHPDIASSYNSMGNVYDSQGDYSKALQYHEKSLNMRLAVYQTTSHPDVADSYRCTGDTSMSLSDFSSAVRYYQESLSTLLQLSCNAEKVELLEICDRLTTAQYYSWFSDSNDS